MSLAFNTSLAAAVLLVPFLASAQAVVPPTLTLTLSKSTMVASANPVYATLPVLTWSSQNAESCNASGAGWSGTLSLSGSQKVNPVVTTTYTITCSNSGGAVTQSVTLTVASAGALQSASALSGYDQLMNEGPVTASGSGVPTFHYVWNQNLQIGSPYTEDIKALQEALTQIGMFTGEITGGFYSKTFAAVKQFQKKNGIEMTGFVGPQTRAKLNFLFGN